MRQATLFSLLLILSGCVAPQSDTAIAKAFFPFADRPTEEVILRHDIQTVKGEVYFFKQDGSRVIHHFTPVGAILDRNTYVISASPALDIADFMSVSFDAENDVQAVIAAAETYCKETGYSRVDSGAIIWIEGNSSALVEFCIPNGVQLPPLYSSGDRVPRKQ